MKKIFVVFCLFTAVMAAAQPAKEYDSEAKKARELYHEGWYRESAHAFSKALRGNHGKAISTDRFMAACAWAKADDVDSAFYHLFYLARVANYHAVDQLSEEPLLFSLHGDNRWQELMQMVNHNKALADAKLNLPVKAILDSIYDNFVAMTRQELDAQKKGNESPEAFQERRRADMKQSALDLIKVKKILDTYGWLSAEEVGQTGNTAIGLVIAIADNTTQEYYLPMMRGAFEKKNVSADRLAFVLDAIAYGRNGKQVYGTKMIKDRESGKLFVLTLEEPEKVNERRATLKLKPKEVEMRELGVHWTLRKYYKDLPEGEKVYARQRVDSTKKQDD